MFPLPVPTIGRDGDVGGPVGRPGGRRGPFSPAGNDSADGRDDGEKNESATDDEQ